MSRRAAGWPLRAFFVVLLVLFVVAAGSGGVYVVVESERDARRGAQREAQFSATAAARQLSDFLVLTKASIRQLALNPQIGKVFADPEGCTLAYSGLGEPDLGHIDILGPGGDVACSSRAKSTDGSFAGYGNEAWLRRAMTGAVFAVPVLDRATGAQAAVNVIPIPGRKGFVAAFTDIRSRLHRHECDRV